MCQERRSIEVAAIGRIEDLPGFARDAFVADHETRVVNEAIARIASDYYRPVDKRSLTNGSVSGAD